MAIAARYKGYRYPIEIIGHAVWLYHRFALSLRDVEELMLARGVAVTYETIRSWCAKFGPDYANQLRQRRPGPGDKWHLDEVFVKTVACVQRRDQTVRSGHRRGKSGLADPPALIPPLVVEEDLEQAPARFRRSPATSTASRDSEVSRITPNGVTYGVDPVRSDALSPSIDVLAAITPNTYSVSGSASATSTARASSMATPITIAAYPDPPTGRTAAHPSIHPRNG